MKNKEIEKLIKTRPQYKFVLAFGNSIIEFESEIEKRINDGWELSGELVITPLPHNPKDRRSTTYLHFAQPMIKVVNVPIKETKNDEQPS